MRRECEVPVYGHDAEDPCGEGAAWELSARGEKFYCCRSHLAAAEYLLTQRWGLDSRDIWRMRIRCDTRTPEEVSEDEGDRRYHEAVDEGRR